MSEEERRNFDTHDWCTFDRVDYNCSMCDCKPWHRIATKPCEGNNDNQSS